MLINCEVARVLQWFPLCNIDIKCSVADHRRACVLLSSLRSAYWNFQIELEYHPADFFGSARKEGGVHPWDVCGHWVLNTEDSLTVSSEWSSQAWLLYYYWLLITIQIKNIYFFQNPFVSFCTGCLAARQVVVFELDLKIILQVFEYQISIYPPKKPTTLFHGDSDLLCVVPGVVMMGLNHAAQFQLLKTSWNRLWRHSFVCLQE